MSRLQVPVSAQDHIQGPANAPLTLVEYGDFECPHCGMAHTVVKRLEKHFGDRMRFVYRNFPLTQIHPMAEPAAEAAEFAGANGKYWPMHDAIFEHQRSLSPELLTGLASRLQLDPEELASAVDEQRFIDKISEDVEGGEQNGVHGTPTFFINGQQYQGPWQFEDLVEAMEAG